jgi:hypothetical protein
MALSVFTRHSSGCKLKRDRLCRRCSCPKWVGGQINGEYFRQSASTRVWEEAERFCERLQATLEKGLPPFDPPPTPEASPQPHEETASRPLTPELPPAEPESQSTPPVSLAPAIPSSLVLVTAQQKILHAVYRARRASRLASMAAFCLVVDLGASPVA